MLVAAIRRRNDLFDHEESRYYTTNAVRTKRYSSDGVSTVGVAELVFTLQLSLANQNASCDKLILNAQLLLEGESSTTTTELLLFAPARTMAYIGYIEHPLGVQLKPIEASSSTTQA